MKNRPTLPAELAGEWEHDPGREPAWKSYGMGEWWIEGGDRIELIRVGSCLSWYGPGPHPTVWPVRPKSPPIDTSAAEALMLHALDPQSLVGCRLTLTDADGRESEAVVKSVESGPPAPQAAGWVSYPETHKMDWKQTGGEPVGFTVQAPTMGTPTRADAKYVRGFYGHGSGKLVDRGEPIDLPCDVPPPPDWTPTPPTEAGTWPWCAGPGDEVEAARVYLNSPTHSEPCLCVDLFGAEETETMDEFQRLNAGGLWWPVAVKLPAGPR